MVDSYHLASFISIAMLVIVLVGIIIFVIWYFTRPKPPVPPTPPPTAIGFQNIKAELISKQGEPFQIQVSWDPIKDARAYQIYYNDTISNGAVPPDVSPESYQHLITTTTNNTVVPLNYFPSYFVFTYTTSTTKSIPTPIIAFNLQLPGEYKYFTQTQAGAGNAYVGTKNVPCIGLNETSNFGECTIRRAFPNPQYNLILNQMCDSISGCGGYTVFLPPEADGRYRIRFHQGSEYQIQPIPVGSTFYAQKQV